jgi:hypothetical protein
MLPAGKRIATVLSGVLLQHLFQHLIRVLFGGDS